MPSGKAEKANQTLRLPINLIRRMKLAAARENVLPNVIAERWMRLGIETERQRKAIPSDVLSSTN